MPSEYKIKDGDTIFDVAILTYGSLEQVYKILQENPEIESIDSALDLVEQPGLSVAYDETFVAPETQAERQVPEVETISKYLVKDAQTIFDLALTLYGDVEKAYKIIEDNPAVIPYINYFVAPGSFILYDPEQKTDMVLTDYLTKNDKVISTADPEINRGSGFTIGYEIESFF